MPGYILITKTYEKAGRTSGLLGTGWAGVSTVGLAPLIQHLVFLGNLFKNQPIKPIKPVTPPFIKWCRVIII